MGSTGESIVNRTGPDHEDLDLSSICVNRNLTGRCNIHCYRAPQRFRGVPWIVGLEHPKICGDSDPLGMQGRAQVMHSHHSKFKVCDGSL